MKKNWNIADLGANLERFGHRLVSNNPVYGDFDWIDAVDLYIIHKFKWLPKDVWAMSTAEKAFVLTQDIKEML